MMLIADQVEPFVARRYDCRLDILETKRTRTTIRKCFYTISIFLPDSLIFASLLAELARFPSGQTQPRIQVGSWRNLLRATGRNSTP